MWQRSALQTRSPQSCRSTDTIPLSYANFDVQLMPRVRERQ
jgi:hypothetical protein